MSKPKIALTRVANACVLLELDGHTVLTDPWFTERWYLRRGEPLGLPVAELPPLTAIVATSFAANHWDLRALAEYPHKASTPVYVSAGRMARQARALGYRRVEALRWHESRELAATLAVEAVPAGRTLLWRNNAYVFSSGQTRVFFGGEIQDVALLQQYRARRASADVALLPTNGLRRSRQIRAAGGEATYIRADVREEDQVRAFVDQVAERYGGLDVCFNNAGITLQKPLHEYTVAEWDDIIGTNLRGTFLSMKYEVPHLIRRGGGTMVITSSSNVHATSENRSAYTASKHGLSAWRTARRSTTRGTTSGPPLVPGPTDPEMVRQVAGAMDHPTQCGRARPRSGAAPRTDADADSHADESLTVAGVPFSVTDRRPRTVDAGARFRAEPQVAVRHHSLAAMECLFPA